MRNPTPNSHVDTGRRRFLKQSAAGLAVVSIPNPLGGVSADDEFEVVHKRVKLPRLPRELRGLRIVMVSDIHSGPYMSKDDMDRYVARINALKPDVILLPGDFVQSRNEEVEPVCDAFVKLRARHGVYGSTGNHDYFDDADYISKELAHAGVRMLRNEHTLIEVKGKELALVGLDDVRSGHPFDSLFRQAVDGLDSSLPNIVLCHKPYYLEEASEYGAGLMVSGHTHGGQFVLARVFGTVITPAALISGYVEGLYRLDATQLYVTRGIGTVGIPVRFNCPPEITVLTLV
ncbi:MAG: metallophosphoesterase [Bacteroidetes bacterium]|nr:metallophosphoesterase [Bacteroidota bacterium]